MTSNGTPSFAAAARPRRSEQLVTTPSRWSLAACGGLPGASSHGVIDSSVVKLGGVPVGKAGAARGLGHQRFVRPVGAAAVRQLEIGGTPLSAGGLAAGDAVPDGPRIEQPGQEVEQDGLVLQGGGGFPSDGPLSSTVLPSGSLR